MNNSEEPDKKINRAKSFMTAKPAIKVKTDPGKRKSFDVNEAVKSLDLALVRLKKSKLVNGECHRHGYPDMYRDISSNSTCCPPGMDNASLLSMNFSHYELARNLSSSLCGSDGAFSSTTCNSRQDSPETIKNEHLERYFRSVEMWSQRYRDGGPSGLHPKRPDK